jgi:type IV secretion system protein VirD4
VSKTLVAHAYACGRAILDERGVASAVTVRSSAARRARADVQSMTWEIPAAGAVVWLLAALLVLPDGQGAASLLFGGGWVWPRGCSALLSSIGGLATGHPGRGLGAGQVGQLPGAGVVYLLVVVGEVLLVDAAIWAGVLWWRHLGPGVWPGMADRFEVEMVLGRSRLRRARKLIRPDLYGTERSPSGAVSVR